jgi:hypothetical protein
MFDGPFLQSSNGCGLDKATARTFNFQLTISLHSQFIPSWFSIKSSICQSSHQSVNQVINLSIKSSICQSNNFLQWPILNTARFTGSGSRGTAGKLASLWRRRRTFEWTSSQWSYLDSATVKQGQLFVKARVLCTCVGTLRWSSYHAGKSDKFKKWSCGKRIFHHESCYHTAYKPYRRSHILYRLQSSFLWYSLFLNIIAITKCRTLCFHQPVHLASCKTVSSCICKL